MAKIDESRPFIPVKIALLTLSDTRSASEDSSGDLLAGRITDAGHQLAARDLIREDLPAVIEHLTGWIDDPGIEVVISTGGTGVTGRDITPEAFAAVWEKEIPGFGEIFRMISYDKVGTSTIQSRAVAGVANGTYLFALPGSNGACKDAWDGILQYQLDYRHRPCNFVELLPRLKENQPG